MHKIIKKKKKLVTKNLCKNIHGVQMLMKGSLKGIWRLDVIGWMSYRAVPLSISSFNSLVYLS